MSSLKYLHMLTLLALQTAHGAHLTGRLYDQINNQGIPGLTIKLTPPTGIKAPSMTTAADLSGQYTFDEASPGRYLLEVYVGLTVVHREVVFVTGDLRKDIGLLPTENRTNLSVPANKPWTSAGIIVKQGQKLSFAATGQIHWGSDSDKIAGPEGSLDTRSSRLGARFAYPVRGMGAGGLIGRIDQGPPFRIGASMSMPMPQTGTLYLGINDNFFRNNSGSVQVSITRLP